MLDFSVLVSLQETDAVRAISIVSIVTIALLATTALQGAEVYRTIDDDGNVSYSDRPIGDNAEAVIIETYAPVVAARTPSAAQNLDGAGAASNPDGTVQRERREPTPEERTEDRAANCTIARERIERYTISRRLFRPLPDGEREYLSDAESDEARARAVADVQEWCD